MYFYCYFADLAVRIEAVEIDCRAIDQRPQNKGGGGAAAYPCRPVAKRCQQNMGKPGRGLSIKNH